MKIFRGAVIAASVLIATSASAQNSYQPPVARIYAAAADTVLAPAATSHAATVAQFLAGRGMPVSAAALIETGGGAALSGLTAVRFEETASGLSLYGVYAKAAFNARGDLVHLIENLSLEEVASEGICEGLFIALPLKITGATGSWLRPILLV